MLRRKLCLPVVAAFIACLPFATWAQQKGDPGKFDVLSDESFLVSGILFHSCGRNHLTAIEACFSKDLKPIACKGLRTCRANSVKITPPESLPAR